MSADDLALTGSRTKALLASETRGFTRRVGGAWEGVQPKRGGSVAGREDGECGDRPLF